MIYIAPGGQCDNLAVFEGFAYTRIDWNMGRLDFCRKVDSKSSGAPYETILVPSACKTHPVSTAVLPTRLIEA